jgi:hypothetical protein
MVEVYAEPVGKVDVQASGALFRGRKHLSFTFFTSEGPAPFDFRVRPLINPLWVRLLRVL